MNQLLSIANDALIIKKLSVETLDGPIETNDDLRVQGNLTVENNIVAKSNVDILGTITVDTLKVKNLVAENESSAKPGNDYTFIARTERQLDGKGLVFLDDEGSKLFVYREGNRLWSSMHLDLDRDKSYQINGIPVLNQTTLGSSITNSNLKKIGTLKELTVAGPVNIDDWAFFNNNLNRFGINTETPNGTVGVVLDNAAEFVINAKDASAVIGTITSNNLEIFTDNKPRMSFKNTGEIVIGNEKFKNGVMKIHGRLEVDQIVTNGNDGALLPITFRTTDVASIQGTGFLWQHDNKNRHLTYNLNPDRIYSSETMDLHRSKFYSIDGNMVISKSSLGIFVTESHLQKLGSLRELNVDGPTNLKGDVNIAKANITSIAPSGSFNITMDGIAEVVIDPLGRIELGHQEHTNRPVIINGQVNINGSLKINSKQVVYGMTSPTQGRWNQGDICYNENPIKGGFIGWVCVESGTPGRWALFGSILNTIT